ncbi:11811_t:CDS:2, partial [Dentiscutata heterogama]
MSNEDLQNVYKNSLTVKDDYPKQDYNSLQQQIYSLHIINENQDFIYKKIIDELCKLHESENVASANFIVSAVLDLFSKSPSINMLTSTFPFTGKALSLIYSLKRL